MEMGQITFLCQTDSLECLHVFIKLAEESPFSNVSVMIFLTESYARKDFFSKCHHV